MLLVLVEVGVYLYNAHWCVSFKRTHTTIILISYFSSKQLLIIYLKPNSSISEVELDIELTLRLKLR